MDFYYCSFELQFAPVVYLSRFFYIPTPIILRYSTLLHSARSGLG